jgi:hypothetical protein
MFVHRQEEIYMQLTTVSWLERKDQTNPNLYRNVVRDSFSRIKALIVLFYIKRL